LAGIIIILLYIKQERGLLRLNHEMIPELNEETFNELKTLLRTLYQRTLYLGLAFLFLASLTISKASFETRIFGLLVILVLFIYNIPPRNKVMKILMDSGVDLKDIKNRGIKF